MFKSARIDRTKNVLRNFHKFVREQVFGKLNVNRFELSAMVEVSLNRQ